MFPVLFETGEGGEKRIRICELSLVKGTGFFYPVFYGKFLD
ncbi:MAG: hypothetical protein ACE5QV_00350 [Fidelibacterota bacterium]